MPLLSLSLHASFCGIGASKFHLPGSQILPSVDTSMPLHPKVLFFPADGELRIRRNDRVRTLCCESSVERIRDGLPKVDLSVSSYDTAWVAMVPSPGSPQVPCFPECIDWIVNNQHSDGSWGLYYRHPSLMKDMLSSTLACVLALKRWNTGEQQVKNGLGFLASNISSAMDGQLVSPIGFDIIFPSMIEHAMDVGLNLHISHSDIDLLILKRERETKRGSNDYSEGRKAYLAYVAEGLSNLNYWGNVMKYQRKNGSLFNSPSTTAAALIHVQDDKALNYLSCLIAKFRNSVPTVYPIDIYTHLCLVDKLERLGIARYFSDEIKIIIDKVYRSWMQNDEEIFSDIATCAMAFRLLRMSGYDISSDVLARFDEEQHFYNSLQGHLQDINAVLQLYKASQIKIENEQVLEKISCWSSHFLKDKLPINAVQGCQVIYQEVDYTLKFPFYANLQRLDHKRNIEHWVVDNIQFLKTSYNSSKINDKDLVKLAIEDFNNSQSIYQKEFEDLESWVKENRLDQLKCARQKLTYCYLSAAATIYPPELSNARISWAKGGVLTTVVDDFFDIGGSREELINLITLIEKWDENYEKEFCSEQVKIIFFALYNTVYELGAKASILQQRNVTNDIVDIWLNLLRSMFKEAEWLRNKSLPTMDEYMTNGYVSFALGPIILPTLYFIGPQLSNDDIKEEYHQLYKLVSTCGRLLNDMQGFKREGKEGKLNSVSLRILHSCGSISEEEAIRDIRSDIDSSRTKLLRLVLLKESVVPRACKELFWNMSRILHLFYMNTDGFTSPKEMVNAVNAVIHEPLKVVNMYSE